MGTTEKGCGYFAPRRSASTACRAGHSYARHVGWLSELLFGHLTLCGITLFGHDWGGLFGLRLVAEHPDAVAGVVAANTGLPTGDQDMPAVWWRFRQTVQRYNAPFPDDSFTAGPRAMPLLVPTTPDDPASAANRAAWKCLGQWERPFLVAFSDSDPITGPMAPTLIRHIPGAHGIEHPVPAGAGHFPRRTPARNWPSR